MQRVHGKILLINSLVTRAQTLDDLCSTTHFPRISFDEVQRSVAPCYEHCNVRKTKRRFKRHGSTWPSTLVFALERASRGHEVSSFFSSRHRRNARWAHRLRSLSRPGFREYTSHRPKLRIFIGLTLLVESERGPRNQKKKV